MRLSKVPLIAGIAFCAASVAFFFAARAAAHNKSIIERTPIHPVTSEMRSEAGREARTQAPPLDRIDTEGERIELAKLSAKGPIFLVFIMDGCPCSIEAQPFFQRMYDAFGARVPFLGITDAKPAAGKEWKAHFQMTFPLISDPAKDLMHAFGAKHSAYTALIAKGGRIVQLWPGYNQVMLGEIRAAIAVAAGIPAPPMAVADAPTKPTSGCVF